MKTKLLKKYPFQVVMYVVSMLLSLAAPYLLGYLIDDIILAKDFSHLGIWFAAALAVTAAANILSFYFMDFETAKQSILNSETLSVDCVKKMLKMPLPLYEKKDKSYYLNVVTSSSFTYGDMHAQIYLEMVSCILCILLILGVTFFVNPYFGLIFLLFVPLVMLSAKLRGGKLAQMQKDAMLRQDAFLGSLQHIINSKREINILKENGFFARSFSGKMASWTEFILKYRFNEYLMEKLPGMLAAVYSVVFLFVGALLISRGRLTPGVLIMEYQYLQLISSPISRVSEILVRRRANAEHIGRVDSFEAADIENREHEERETEKAALFRAEDFSFYTDESHEIPLFSAKDIEIPDRGLYLIKGQNGTGKSMLLNFLFGTLDVKAGSGSFSFATAAGERTAFLSYPLFFIDGSFRDNLFGKKFDPKLLKILNIDFADQEITTNPVNLSLGQQQKIALLRVLSMESDFLFLDEPLSNLDTETQENLKNYVQTLRERKTVVAIMHDETFDEFADGIYRIREGRLAAEPSARVQTN